jgi:hypothetical protein
LLFALPEDSQERRPSSSKTTKKETKYISHSFQKHRFPHLLVVGIARNPRQVKRSINKKKFIKKTGVKPFVKYVNQNHVMPTRFVANDFDFKELKEETLKTK